MNDVKMPGEYVFFATRHDDQSIDTIMKEEGVPTSQYPVTRANQDRDFGVVPSCSPEFFFELKA